MDGSPSVKPLYFLVISQAPASRRDTSNRSRLMLSNGHPRADSPVSGGRVFAGWRVRVVDEHLISRLSRLARRAGHPLGSGVALGSRSAGGPGVPWVPGSPLAPASPGPPFSPGSPCSPTSPFSPGLPWLSGFALDPLLARVARRSWGSLFSGLARNTGLAGRPPPPHRR